MPPHEINAALFGTAPDMGRPNHPPRQSHESIYPGGLLDAAQGGTVLFHDLGEMPDRVQSKLARLFRDGEFLAGGRGQAAAHRLPADGRRRARPRGRRQ